MKRNITLSVAVLLMALSSFGQDSSLTVFNVKQFGATGDGHTLDTKAFQQAIAACVKAGGGTVYVPAGRFVTGSVQLFSNINLSLSPGAVILASGDSADYLVQSDYGFSGSGAGKRLGIFFAVHAQNVSVTGTGAIDGNAAAFMYMDSVQVSGEADWKYARQGRQFMEVADKEMAPVMWKGAYVERPGTQLIFHDCRKVLIRDIAIRNANDWSIDLNACDDAKVLGISIQNDMRVPNSDGIDMYDSRNVIIADCDIRAGDDAIAVIGSSNVKVTNCNLSSRSCGIRIGYNVFNDRASGHLLFDNIRIDGCNRGIGIFQRRRGDMEDMIFSNMIIDTRLHPGQWWGHAEPIHISALPGLGSKEVGVIRRIRFSNIIATGEQGILLYGSPESTLSDIRLDHVQLRIRRGVWTDRYGGNFDLRPANDPAQNIFAHDIPAIYARYIRGLSIRDFDLHWDASLPAFFYGAVDCNHFEELTVDGFTGNAGSRLAANKAVLVLRNGKGAWIRDLRLPLDDTGNPEENIQWLSQADVSGLQFFPGFGEKQNNKLR